MALHEPFLFVLENAVVISRSAYVSTTTMHVIRLQSNTNFFYTSRLTIVFFLALPFKYSIFLLLIECKEPSPKSLISTVSMSFFFFYYDFTSDGTGAIS